MSIPKCVESSENEEHDEDVHAAGMNCLACLDEALAALAASEEPTKGEDG